MPVTPDTPVRLPDLAESMTHVGLPGPQVRIEGDVLRVCEPVMGVVAQVFDRHDGSWTVEAWHVRADDSGLVSLAAEAIWSEHPTPTVVEDLFRADIPRVDAISVWLEIEKQRPWCRTGEDQRRSWEEMNADALAVTVWQQLAVAQINGPYRELLDRCPGLWLNFVGADRTSSWQAEGLWFGHQVNFYYSSGGGRLTIGGPVFDPCGNEQQAARRDGMRTYWEAAQSWPDPFGMFLTPELMTERFSELVGLLEPVAYPYLFPVLSRVEAERLSVGVGPWLNQDQGMRERIPVMRWACGTELKSSAQHFTVTGVSHPFTISP